MLKRFKNNKAQANVGEYVIVLFLVVGMATAMSVYFRRGIQGRMRDASRYVGRTLQQEAVLEDANGQPQALYQSRGPFYSQYEPYYQNTVSNVFRGSETQEYLFPTHDHVPERGFFESLPVGIYQKGEESTSNADTFQDTAAPRFGHGR